jgi:hypothetical protein
MEKTGSRHAMSVRSSLLLSPNIEAVHPAVVASVRPFEAKYDVITDAPVAKDTSVLRFNAWR